MSTVQRPIEQTDSDRPRRFKRTLLPVSIAIVMLSLILASLPVAIVTALIDPFPDTTITDITRYTESNAYWGDKLTLFPDSIPPNAIEAEFIDFRGWATEGDWITLSYIIPEAEAEQLVERLESISMNNTLVSESLLERESLPQTLRQGLKRVPTEAQLGAGIWFEDEWSFTWIDPKKGWVIHYAFWM